MPKAVDIDWNVARGLAAQGFTPSQIAKKLNCNAGTIRSRACREKWTELAAKTTSVMQSDPESEAVWKERAKKWPRRVAALMERRLEYLESIPVSRLSMKELKELSSTTAETDAMARKAFGIDEELKAGPLSLQLSCAVIELAREGEPPIEISTASPPLPPAA